MTTTHLLGFDIGGTKCAVVLGRVDESQVTLLDRCAFPTAETRTPEATLLRLEQVARELLPRHGLSMEQVQSLGISCGGPLDSQRGRIQGPPNLPGWEDVPIVAWCEEHLGLRTYLQNDANACAMAEWRWGAGRGCRHLIFLTFGTGMGAGLILNGRLYSGACDLAGEAGHMRMAEDGPFGYGKSGSFEGFCSGGGMADAMRRLRRDAGLPDQEFSAHEVFMEAQSGNAIAQQVVNDTAHHLGRGLALLLDILNPERIILGSIFLRQRDALWPITERVLNAEALPASLRHCQILPAALGEELGDYASMAVALGEE